MADVELQQQVQVLSQRLERMEELLGSMSQREQSLATAPLPPELVADPSDRTVENLQQRIADLEAYDPLWKPQLLSSGSDDWFLAQIVATGPLGTESDYSDERYWVKEQRLSNTSGANTTDLTFEDAINPIHVTASNLAELATAAHELDTDGTVKVVVRCENDQQPIPRYIFDSNAGVIADPADPDDIGVTPEGSDAADSETWDRESPTAGKDGCKIRVTCRVVYDHSGDEELHGFWRLFTFDQYGRLTDISAETEYTIDTPSACP